MQTTVCPRSSDPFYIVPYYINRVDSINRERRYLKLCRGLHLPPRPPFPGLTHGPGPPPAPLHQPARAPRTPAGGRGRVRIRIQGHITGTQPVYQLYIFATPLFTKYLTEIENYFLFVRTCMSTAMLVTLQGSVWGWEGGRLVNNAVFMQLCNFR